MQGNRKHRGGTALPPHAVQQALADCPGQHGSRQPQGQRA
jgi:hypothetical protein